MKNPMTVIIISTARIMRHSWIGAYSINSATNELPTLAFFWEIVAPEIHPAANENLKKVRK